MQVRRGQNPLNPVENSFSLDQAIQALFDRAIKAQHEATDYFRFTSQINNLCSPSENNTLTDETIKRSTHITAKHRRYI
jgi:hypothetical protein